MDKLIWTNRNDNFAAGRSVDGPSTNRRYPDSSVQFLIKITMNSGQPAASMKGPGSLTDQMMSLEKTLGAIHHLLIQFQVEDEVAVRSVFPADELTLIALLQHSQLEQTCTCVRSDGVCRSVKYDRWRKPGLNVIDR